MKIAVVARGILRDLARMEDGGPDWQLIRAYRSAGHQVKVLSQHEENHSRMIEKEHDGILIVAHPRWQRPWKTAWADKLIKPFMGHRKLLSDALAVRDFLDRSGLFDVVDARNEEADGLPVALASTLGAMPPWAIQIFGLPYVFKGELPVWKRLRIYRWMFSKAMLIRANSKRVTDVLVTDYRCAPNKIEIVHPNIGRVWETLVLPVLPSPVGSHKNIVCLAAINTKKGADLFIQAAERWIPEFPEARFILIGGVTAGDGYAQRWLPRAQSLAPHFIVAGKVSASDVLQYLQNAYACVIPSRFDEFNRAALEAILACPRVLISSGCGVIDHLPSDEAIHFFNPDLESTIKAIHKILTGMEQVSISAATRKAIQSAYSTEAIADRNIAVLEKLICKGE